MNLFKLPEGQIILFALVLMRIISFMVSSAIFGTINVSVQLKILISFVLTFLIFSSISARNLFIEFDINNLVLCTIKEISVGLAIGFLTRIFFLVVGMAGDFISISIGLGSAQLFNPAMGSTGNVLEQFYSLIGILLFLALNGHHLMISALVESFDTVHIGVLQFHFETLKEIVILLQDLLIITIRIAAPVLVTALIINVAMAMLGRIVPQINVQVTTVPVNLLIGFGIIFICMPILVGLMTQTIDFSLAKIFQFVKGI